MNNSVIKPGDKFKRRTDNPYRGWKAGDGFTCKGVLSTVAIDINDLWHDRDRIEKVADIQDLDVQKLIDDVTAGRIQRGGVQGKFVVYTNDVGDTIIQLFKQRKG